MRRSGAVIICLAALSVSCASSRPVESDRHAVPDTITHIVVCWLKQPGDEQAVRKIVETSEGFAQIPGVRRVVAGPRYKGATTRPIDETTFDVAVVMTFDSEAALRAYQHDPRHERAVRDVLRPLTQRIVVYDVATARR